MSHYVLSSPESLGIFFALLYLISLFTVSSCLCIYLSHKRPFPHTTIYVFNLCVGLLLGLDKKKRALKFALKGSESFKACFELYWCLNPEKSFKSNFKNGFWAFFHDFCSTMFWVVAWVQVELRSLSSFRRSMLFDWLLLLLLLSKFTFSRDCVQGWWVPIALKCVFLQRQIALARSHTL